MHYPGGLVDCLLGREINIVSKRVYQPDGGDAERGSLSLLALCIRAGWSSSTYIAPAGAVSHNMCERRITRGQEARGGDGRLACEKTARCGPTVWLTTERAGDAA